MPRDRTPDIRSVGIRFPREERGGLPMRKHRKSVLGATLLVLALAAGACSSGGGGSTTSPSGAASSPPVQRGTMTIGVSGQYAENQHVAELWAQVLEKAGYTAKHP